MSGVPSSTKVMLIVLVIVGIRFFWALSNNSEPTQIKKEHSKQKITPQPVQQILTCDQYKKQIQACTKQAMGCLSGIAQSKKYHEQNEQKILKCQAQNEKNLQLNKQLRVKLDAVTQRLNELLKKRQKATTNPDNVQL